MTDPNKSERSGLWRWLGVGVPPVLLAAGFAWAGGWLSPHRLTPAKLVASLAPADGVALGHRRNHVKGICYTGTFTANGNGVVLSRAQVFAAGTYPVVGRFNMATADINAADGALRVRGMGLMISTPDGQQWRSAMIDAPFFPVATPQAFYELQRAVGAHSPDAMAAFAAKHPEIKAFGMWAKSAPWTGSYAEERFNSLNAFRFTNAQGDTHVVRWSFVPKATPVAVDPKELAGRAPNFLETEIAQRVSQAPQSWVLQVTSAGPQDPTSDPSKLWPQDRQTIDVGTLTVTKVEPEPDGPCRDINYDPTVLPDGMNVSDDPFPSARSAAYARSFNARTAEERDYPRTTTDEGTHS